MQVKDIARTWGISVSNFMRIARSHLSVQHPTATYYLILADTCADAIQVKSIEIQSSIWYYIIIWANV